MNDRTTFVTVGIIALTALVFGSIGSIAKQNETVVPTPQALRIGQVVPNDVSATLASTKPHDKRYLVFIVTRSSCSACADETYALNRQRTEIIKRFRVIFLTKTPPLLTDAKGYEYVRDDGRISALLGVGDNIPYIVIADSQGRIKYKGEGSRRTRGGTFLSDMLMAFATGKATEAMPLTLWSGLPKSPTDFAGIGNANTNSNATVVTFFSGNSVLERLRARSVSEFAQYTKARFVCIETDNETTSSLPLSNTPNVVRVRDIGGKYARAFDFKGDGPVSMIFYRGRRVAAERNALPDERMFAEVINASLFVADSPYAPSGFVGANEITSSFTKPTETIDKRCGGAAEMPCQ